MPDKDNITGFNKDCNKKRRKRLRVALPGNISIQFKNVASANNTNRSALIKTWVQEYLDDIRN